MEILPCRLGQIRLRADEVANHLPGCQVQSAFRSRSHGKRNGALWTKTNPPSRRFLARTNPCRLREQEHSHRFFTRLKFPITAKAILTIQFQSPASMAVGASARPKTAMHPISLTFSNVLMSGQVCRKIPGFGDSRSVVAMLRGEPSCDLGR